MLMITNLICMIFMISMMMFMIYSFLSKTKLKNREKITPFECGFDPISQSRLPFSLHFFIICVMFLIFDIEIAIMIPMIKSISLKNFYIWMITSYLFIFILIFGLYMEWKEGALKWLK
uniref:NADH-ubiquinone oxidoreductase chain 3 n=1 Tax=Exallonyx sp. ZJUH_2016014 TaxID=2491158 RepID=A0A3Q8U9S7_9HYME|nr:NADH dehydrogenase subunit 3 [Exallonyx sp. ZJUH_2016014]